MRAVLACALAAFCLAARAQPQDRVAQVGVILYALPASEFAGTAPAHPFGKAFVEALAERGWLQGRNLRLHWRSLEMKPERLPEIVEELAHLPVDVLVAGGNRQAIEAKKRARGLPIVMIAAYHPDEYGIVSSLPKPGGSVTGALLEPGRGINEKRIALLKETVPGLKRIALLSFADITEDVHAELRNAAAPQGVDIFPVSADTHPPGVTPHGIEWAMGEARRLKADAVLVGSGPQYSVSEIESAVHASAIRNRLPVMHCLHLLGQNGGLMSYATDLRENYRIAARLTDSILRGARPADLPVEQTTRFLLTVNVGAAKAIGLTIPASILARADRVIE